MKEFKCRHYKRHKKRSEEESKMLMNRLNRIDGQIHAVKEMLVSNVYYPDILIQSAAISAAISSFNKELGS